MQWSSWEAELINISAGFTDIPFLLESVPATKYDIITYLLHGAESFLKS